VSHQITVFDRSRPPRSAIVTSGALIVLLVLFIALDNQDPRPPIWVALIIICLSALRMILRPMRDHGHYLKIAHLRGIEDQGQSAISEDSKRFALARFLYYLGMLTVTQTVLRKGGFAVSDWIFLASVVATVVEGRRERQVPGAASRALSVGVVLLLAGGILSSANARDPVSSYLQVLKYFYVVCIWLWLGSLTLRNVAQVRTALCCWIISAAISGLAGIAEVVFPFGAAARALAGGGRAIGLTEHANELGMVEAMALLPALVMLGDSRGFLKKLVWAALGLFIVGGLILSVSVSALTGLLVASTLWMIGLSRPTTIKKRYLVTMLVLVITSTGFAIRFQSVHRLPNIYERLESLRQRSGGGYTVGTRLRTYRAAWERIGNDPFVGVGLDEKSARAADNWEVHNMLLLQWYEGGILSFLGITIIVYAVWSLTWMSLVRSDNYVAFRISLALYLSFIAFFIYAMTTPESRHRDAWLFAALPVAMEAVRRRLTPECA